MATTSISTARPTSVPFEVYQTMLDHEVEAEQAAAREANERYEKAEKVIREYRAELYRLLGAERYEQYRTHVVEQRELAAQQSFEIHRIAAAEYESPKGRDTVKANQHWSKEMESAHKQRQLAASTFLKDLGTDVAKLEAIRQRARGELASVLALPIPMRDEKPVVAMLPMEVPKLIRAAAPPNPWTTLHAPYAFTCSSAPYVKPRGFTYALSSYLERLSGTIGNRISLIDSDAGDSDLGVIDFSGALCFWYRMPTAGLVEAWIEAQCAGGAIDIHLSDEWGWSDSTAFARDSLTMKVDGGNPYQVGTRQESVVSSFQENGSTDGTWHRGIPLGNIVWAHLFSDKVFPAGSWVAVRIGARNYESVWVNDVSAFARTDFRWFLKSVTIRSTGS